MTTEPRPAVQPVGHDEGSAKESNGLPSVRTPVRNASFPTRSLAQAPPVLREAGKYGFAHSDSAVASYMGLSTTNSGTFRERVAAFRDFGLLAGRGGTLTMTEVAQRIARPLSDEDERHALQEAFLNCEIFARLYEDSAKGVPLKLQHLEARAVRDFQVSPKNGKRFMRSFVDSLVVAELGELSAGESVTLNEKGDFGIGAKDGHAGPGGSADLVPSDSANPNPGSSSTPTPISPTDRPARISTQSEPAIHQIWEIQSGHIVFQVRVEGPLPSDAYTSIVAVITSIEELVKTLGPDQPIGQVDEPEDGTDGPEA